MFVAFGIVQQVPDLVGHAAKPLPSSDIDDPVYETKEVICKDGTIITCTGKECRTTEDGQMAPDGSDGLTGRCHCEGQRTVYCPSSVTK